MRFRSLILVTITVLLTNSPWAAANEFRVMCAVSKHEKDKEAKSESTAGCTVSGAELAKKVQLACKIAEIGNSTLNVVVHDNRGGGNVSMPILISMRVVASDGNVFEQRGRVVNVDGTLRRLGYSVQQLVIHPNRTQSIYTCTTWYN